jgi:hypothetical protein
MLHRRNLCFSVLNYFAICSLNTHYEPLFQISLIILLGHRRIREIETTPLVKSFTLNYHAAHFYVKHTALRPRDNRLHFKAGFPHILEANTCINHTSPQHNCLLSVLSFPCVSTPNVHISSPDMTSCPII